MDIVSPEVVAYTSNQWRPRNNEAAAHNMNGRGFVFPQYAIMLKKTTALPSNAIITHLFVCSYQSK